MRPSRLSGAKAPIDFKGLALARGGALSRLRPLVGLPRPRIVARPLSRATDITPGCGGMSNRDQDGWPSGQLVIKLASCRNSWLGSTSRMHATMPSQKVADCVFDKSLHRRVLIKRDLAQRLSLGLRHADKHLNAAILRFLSRRIVLGRRVIGRDGYRELDPSSPFDRRGWSTMGGI